VGIEQGHLLSPCCPVQSQLLHSQARRTTGKETVPKVGIFWCFIKSPTTRSLLPNESETLIQNGVAGISAGTFPTAIAAQKR